MALNKLLNTDLSALAQMLQAKGRGKDTVLAHITPKEAALLKARGGRGSRNPDTGLLEFDDEETVAPTPVTVQPEVSSGGEGTYNVPTGGITGTPGGEATAVSAPAPTETYGGPLNVPYSAPFSAEDIQAGQAPTSGQLAQFQQQYPAPADVSGAMQSLQGPTKQPSDFLGNVTAALTKPDTLGRLGLAGALTAYNAYQNRQAQGESDTAAAQKQALAAPYQQQGQQLIAQAQRGELTAANQQTVQAARARLQQASANMGGVGQQQIETQIAGLTTQLLNNQYQYGLQVMQIGDNIALGAINTQLQLDQQLNQASKQFMSSMASIVAGGSGYVPGLYNTNPTRSS